MNEDIVVSMYCHVVHSYNILELSLIFIQFYHNVESSDNTLCSNSCRIKSDQFFLKCRSLYHFMSYIFFMTIIYATCYIICQIKWIWRLSGSLARSMWRGLLWRWKFSLHCKWLAYCLITGLPESILSWQRIDEVYKSSLSNP